MRAIKENESFKTPRERTIAFFLRGGLRFSSDLHFSFVCGAADPEAAEPLGYRRQFLDWAAERQSKLVCVRAENAVTDLLRQVDERRKSKSLSVIEETIAQTVDSLLIFPESAGSLAELGFFSANKKICEKTLVVMEARHQNGSFIMLGPVKHIADFSAFNPNPIIISPNIDQTFQQIETRLVGEAGARRPYLQHYVNNSWKGYKNREKVAILDAIFDLMGFCTEEDLLYFIRSCFGAYDVSELRLLVGLLAALGRIERTDEGDIVKINSCNPPRLMLGEDDEVIELKAKWSESYRAYLPEVARAIEARNP